MNKAANWPRIQRLDLDGDSMAALKAISDCGGAMCASRIAYMFRNHGFDAAASMRDDELRQASRRPWGRATTSWFRFGVAAAVRQRESNERAAHSYRMEMGVMDAEAQSTWAQAMRDARAEVATADQLP